jgi:hypothetical protein
MKTPNKNITIQTRPWEVGLCKVENYSAKISYFKFSTAFIKNICHSFDSISFLEKG